jgi:hypothetical protein
MAHARGRDPLVSFLLRLIRAVFWISPALWVLERVINSEREAGADRAAIVALSNESDFESVTISYAETLFIVAKKINSFEQQNGKSPVIGIGDGSGLEKRIRRLLSSSQTTGLHIISAIAAGALTLTTAAVIPLADYSDKLVSLQKETAHITGKTEARPAQENSSSAAQNDPCRQLTCVLKIKNYMNKRYFSFDNRNSQTILIYSELIWKPSILSSFISFRVQNKVIPKSLSI